MALKRWQELRLVRFLSGEWSPPTGGVDSATLNQAIEDKLNLPENQLVFHPDEFYVNGQGQVCIDPDVVQNQVDALPTDGSTNAVQSNGVFDKFANLIVDQGLATTAYVDDAVQVAGAQSIVDGAVTDAKLNSDVKVGSLASLETTIKTSVVAAVNELVGRLVRTTPAWTASSTHITGLVFETEPGWAVTTTFAGIAGSFLARRFKANRTCAITHLSCRVSTGGAGLTNDPTQNGLAIYSSDGATRLGYADGSTAFGSFGDKVLVANTTINLVADTWYIFALNSQGTTPATFQAIAGSNLTNFEQAAAPYNWHRVQNAAGLTASIATTGGTIVALTGSRMWMAGLNR